MKRSSEEELKKAGDYEELKWYNGTPIVVAAFGETWKRIASAEGYSPNFIVSDGDETEDFFSTYSDDEPVEPSN
jgi:hypothetical protein